MMTISITFMRYYCVVIDQGGISRAAANLNVAASAISSAIDLIEEQLNLTLLNRFRSRGVLPTKSGKAIYLEVDFDMLWKRIENSNRPLVKFGKESVRGLFEKRIDKYQSLQHILPISSEENSYTALLNALELNK